MKLQKLLKGSLRLLKAPKTPTYVPKEPAQKLTNAGGCKTWPLRRRATKCHIPEDMFRYINYVDPRVPSQKG